jgi:general secretion pathway protein J
MSGFPRGERGFTLIEVLVALALMALISVILIASLEIGGHTWQRVTRAATSDDEIAQAQDFLREHLRVLYPYEVAAASTGQPSFLVSDGQSLEFSSYSPASVPDGMLRFRIVRLPASGMLQVESRHDVNGLPDPLSPDWAAEPLLPQVTALSVQFLVKADGESGHWVDRWMDPVKLPQLIRIDVTFSPTDRRRWPSLYVEPRVDTPATCEFDAVSRRCRRGA